ncbi:uncharacterized protein LOC111702613 [Eurytemora carolleeae]|uniref:uncharacterized protein LOC111702613 n=1 Tax=Eurytemora carolleeae TaxID=1294199 RepID=UPI000C757247|nr:uncharacterized protein LOC111702613 [Eurytemora carolleeae]|eukprot:XP_023330135.1 uncharacterized protein LOC111702613 [Eurytemora affinis]
MSVPGSMLALRKTTPGVGYTLASEKVPTPLEDEVLLEIEKVAICGSDIALYNWTKVAQVIANIPFIPGHEAVGTVVARGTGCTVNIGTRVCVENHFYCGTCYTCKEGRGDICAKMDQYGHGRGTEHGGFSEYSIVKERFCYVLKHGLSPLQAVLLEPMGVAHNGVENIDVKNQDVLILGAGPIGLLAISISKALGCRRVLVADINQTRLDLAVNMGADITIDSLRENLHARVMELTDGVGISRLVEATGAPSIVNNCFSLLRKGAKLVLIGLPKSAIHIEDPLQNVIFKSLTLVTVHGRRIFDTWEKCEELISTGQVDPTLIVSHQLELNSWQEAFDLLISVGLGIDVLICGGLYTAYNRTLRIIKDLSSAPELSIESNLKDQISSHPQAQVCEDGSIRLPYALVKGNVSALGKTVSSAYAPEIMTGVIQRVVFTEHKRNRSRTGFWIDSERVLHQYNNDAPFCIINPQDSSFSLSRPRVEISDWVDATRIDLDTVYDKFEQGATDIGSNILGWVAGDIHKGTQVTEKMLLKGTHLTAVGELVYNQTGVKMVPPSDNRPYFLVKNSIASLIKDFESEKAIMKVFLGIFTGVGLGISFLIAYKFYQRRKLESISRANQETITNIRSERATRQPRSDIPDSLTCVVCLGAEREVILLNCGHVCVCADCGEHLVRDQHNCPVCRAQILSILPAYVS